MNNKPLNWKRDGAVIVTNLFKKKHIRIVIKKLEILESKGNIIKELVFDKIGNKKKLRYVPNASTHIEIVKEMLNSNILNFASKLLKSNVYVLDTDIHIRSAGNTNETPPHQDSYLKYLKSGHEHMLTCYVALTNITIKSSPMKIIKGSHLQKTLNHKKSLISGFSTVIEETADKLSSDILKNEHDVILNAGDALFFHSKIIHYTKNRLSIKNKERKAMSIRVCDENAVFCEKRRKLVNKNISYNRKNSIKLGLTNTTKLI